MKSFEFISFIIKGRDNKKVMITEVEKGNIGTIIVKDMSRLGRNYV